MHERPRYPCLAAGATTLCLGALAATYLLDRMPHTVESIAYHMPAYEVPNGRHVYFAAWKQHCSLHGVPDFAGDFEADWLFVGEGPGAEEDERGEPFVGQAGKLLDAMLAAIDLKRGKKVYIGNAVKCRPPGNRTPEAEETAACFPYLQRQIELIRPRLIVALGKPAAETLLNAEVKIGASRGRLFDYRGIPLIVTYHPAYLLRNLTDKAKAWEDLCLARRTMQGLPDVGR